MSTYATPYDGTCRYCGSPTIGGKHAHGWTGCRNYVPTQATNGLKGE